MKHLRAFFALSAVAATLLLAAVSSATAPPRTISVGGYLADPSGAPLEGTFTFRVDFYGNPGGPVLDTVDTTTTLTAGTFNIPAALSDEVLDQPEVSYRVWADVDHDGLTESDRFPEVFKLSAVPRAHRAAPADAWRELAARLFDGPRSYNLRTGVMPQIRIAELAAPATGLQFNTMTIKASTNTAPYFQGLNETHYEVGFYNRKGDLLAKSRMPLRLTPTEMYASTTTYLQVVVPETVMPPGLNYTAFASDIKSPNGDRYIRYIGGTVATPDPFALPPSRSDLPAPNGVLPASFPEIGRVTTTEPAPAVTLEYLPEAAELPIGAYRRSDQETKYQWNMPAETKYQSRSNPESFF